MRVLLVDDDHFIRNLISYQLETGKCTVDEENNVDDAILALQKNKYDLLITDIVMPHKDGGQLMKYVHEQGIDMPILAITGGLENGQEDYAHYADLFADETLIKPIKKEDLIATVKRLCKSSEGTAS